MASMQFTTKIDSFQCIAIRATNAEKTGFDCKKIVSDSCSLMHEPVLTTQNLFLKSYYMHFWLPHFEWLKIVDPISEVSGYASRHLSIHTFITSQHLTKMKTQWQSTLNFAEFMNQKSVCSEEEQCVLYNALPNSFFDDAQAMFEKHLHHNEYHQSCYQSL